MKSGYAPKKFATLKDVAKRAGTTAATVSFVLNGSSNRYVTDELREKVERAARELNYVKFGAASSLKGKKAGVIAVLSPQYENHYFAAIFKAIEHTAHERGYVLATLNTFDDTERERHAIDQMVRLRVDGFLIIPTIAGGVNTEVIRAHNVPFVAVERPLTGVDGGYDFISSNNYDASYKLTINMLERGHRRIALAYWDSEISSGIENLGDRRTGYVDAMREYGVYDPSLVFEGDIAKNDGANITERVLRDKDITGIVYSQYSLSEGGIKYLRDKKISIPKDISAAILGAPYWIDMVETDFTHVIQPGERVGQESVETLLARIDGDGSDAVVSKIPGVLHEGKSVLKIERYS